MYSMGKREIKINYLTISSLGKVAKRNFGKSKEFDGQPTAAQRTLPLDFICKKKTTP